MTEETPPLHPKSARIHAAVESILQWSRDNRANPILTRKQAFEIAEAAIDAADATQALKDLEKLLEQMKDDPNEKAP